jgi:hypothetical protein
MPSGDGRRPDMPGCSDEGLLVECDNVDELLDVFRRSWCCPVLNCTSSGEEGCEPRLGEECGPLTEGDDGRPVGLFVDNVRLREPGSIGLFSNDGEGDVMFGDWRGGVCLFCGSMASARNF